MSISYDTMSAYMERESNRLAEEDKAVQKQIADDAIVTTKIADKNVTLAKLSDAVQASLALADSALQSSDAGGESDRQTDHEDGA